jgi:5'-nucleotidase
VLITNDDGLDSPPTLELARAFAQVAEVYLVAPVENQSSGTNFASAARTSRFDVEVRDVGEGIRAWAVDGFPADCVFFALAGPMRDAPPDLVISGVNTGANLADAWILSGTIGAARVASYYGVPSIAVSGIDEEDAEAVKAVAAWVVNFAQSEAVRRLEPPQFLTVSLPIGPVSQIRGVEVTERARGLRDMTAELLKDESEANGRQTWSFDVARDAFPAPPNTDAAVVADGRIAIVAMRVDEADPQMHEWLLEHEAVIPGWRANPAVP